MRAANQLTRSGPTDVDDAPDYDDMMISWHQWHGF